MYLSVVIPFFNEDDIIEKNILQIYNYLKPKFNLQIIIINDSGKDNQILNQICKKQKIIELINNNKNYGKGYSVRKGSNIAKGELILITDADLSTPIEEFQKLYNCFINNSSIVIGSRNLLDSDVTIKQPIYRIVAGRIYNYLIKNLLKLNFNDTQCGFKLFRRSVLQNLLKNTKSNRFGLDLELIYFAKKNNYEVKEIGIKWKNRNQSSVSFFRDSLIMFYEIIKLRFR